MYHNFLRYVSFGQEVLNHVCGQHGLARSYAPFMDKHFCGIVGMVVEAWAGRQLDNTQEFLDTCDQYFLMGWSEGNLPWDYDRSLRDNGIAEADVYQMFLTEMVEAWQNLIA